MTEATAESPGSLIEMAFGIFKEMECMMGTIHRTLETTGHDVDPSGSVDLGGCLAGAEHDLSMRVVEIDHGAEGAEPIAVNFRTADKMGFRPVLDGLLAEGRHGLNDGHARMPFLIGGHGNELAFVLRVSPLFADGVFPAKIGIPDPHDAADLASGLAVGHRLHQLVCDAPCASVANSEVALEHQGRLTILAVSRLTGRQRNQVVNGSLVQANTVPARRLVCAWQALRWLTLGLTEALETARARLRSAQTRSVHVAAHATKYEPRSIPAWIVAERVPRAPSAGT